MYQSYVWRRVHCKFLYTHSQTATNAYSDSGVEAMIEYPVYIGEQPPLYFEWGMMTTPQPQIDNQTRPAPCGRGVGGGSLINGMLWNRGSRSDFDAWAELGNPGWNWEGLLPYFRKSETFTPIAYAGQHLSDSEQVDSFNPRVHGFQGPVEVSYPAYLWPQSVAWFEALEALGVPKCNDPNDGSMAGGYFMPLSVHPSQQTRSDARRVYWDPVSNRSNLNIAVNAQVLHILFDDRPPQQPAVRALNTPMKRPYRSQNGTIRATGVEIAYDANVPRQQIFARREVILAAGGLHTAQILEHSGVGDASHLEDIGIPTVVDLPGVGNNLQDHAMIHLDYHYENDSIRSSQTLIHNATFFAQAEVEYFASRTGPWTAKPSSAVAFPSLQHVTNATYTADVLGLASMANASNYAPPMPHAVAAGYSAQLRSLIRALNDSTVPSHEILNDNAGGLDLGLMRPLSRGTVHASNADPFTHPIINPNWLSHPLDREIMLRAMEFNHRLLQTPQLDALQPSFHQVPLNATTAQLSAILSAGIGTEYHFCGAAAMAPRELGGVVDPELVVYGTQNLRVVDSSIFPIIPGAHLQAVVYGVAEKAADIIGGDWRGRLEVLEEELRGQVPKGEFWEWLGEELGLEVNVTGDA